MMTYLYIWAFTALITTIALQHEVTALRKLVGLRPGWNIVSILFLLALGSMVPLGLLYVWALMKKNEAIRAHIRRTTPVEEAL